MQEQLFDLQNDPFELNDIIDSPEHQELLTRMRMRLSVLRDAAK